MTILKIATYNIHKGFSQFNRRVVLHELRERLRELNADIVFLQEAQGEHAHHPERHHNYPECAQHEFLAEEVWPHCAYGKNAVYRHGHHGNAVTGVLPVGSGATAVQPPSPQTTNSQDAEPVNFCVPLSCVPPMPICSSEGWMVLPGRRLDRDS